MGRMRPVMFAWNGESMVPLARFRPLCAKQFAVGEEYPLAPVENRSMASHNHYFASVEEAWDNLAEQHAVNFPTSEHLRAWALVVAGFATETNYVMDTPKDAKKMAVAVRKADAFAVIRVSGNVVHVFNAESQSMAAMKRERFEASKKAVLDILAPMARTTPDELKKEAARRVPPRRTHAQQESQDERPDAQGGDGAGEAPGPERGRPH